jgi:hypothetical protein
LVNDLLIKAFADITHYGIQFQEKIKYVVEMFNKESIRNDMNKVLQNMTLDILGSCIFHHEFNSLKGENQEDLNAYNELIDSFFQFSKSFKLMLTPNFFPNHKRLQRNIDYLLNMMKKLIDESKEKIKKGGKLKSMLDYMVNSQDGEDGLTDNELISNW